MRPPATTVEIVEAWALREPDRLCLREEGTALTYGQFFAMLLRLSLRLRQAGVKAGDRVAVAGPGFGLQLALLLAAEGLGAATASFQAQDDADAPFLFTQVQWVFAGQPQAVPAGVHFELVDTGFVGGLAPAGRDGPAWAVPALEEPQRISRTSGSTGLSKFMLLRRRSQEQWIRVGLEAIAFSAQPRALVLAPLLVNAAFTRSCACLRHGGVLLVGPGSDIAAMAPSYVWGLPVHLERLLAELPAGYAPAAPVPVGTFGGVVAPALRERVLAVFGGRIANRYGSNETSSICDNLDANATGVLSPGVDLRILDPQGLELPAGETGVIAVRTAAMVEGYLERPQESAAAFRDGWFVTGDVGALIGRRTLRLVGRHDALVNIGGIKVPAHRLEADLRQQPAIADCAALSVQLEGGTVVGLALVLAPGAAPEAARAQVQAALRAPPGVSARIVFLAQLPRVAAGKVDRMALLREFQR